MRIVWSPLAIERVAEMAEYVARDNPTAAARWVESVFAAVKRLSTFAESGRHVPETRRADIREVLLGSYRIIYRLDRTAIMVLTVRHGKQMLPADEVL